jgi:hypothetical protein
MRCHSYHNSYCWEGIAILLRNSKTLAFIEASLSLLLLSSIVTPNIAHAQSSNGTQLWTDPENDVKIVFTYSPKNPSLDKPTELKFSVSNLLTGQHLKNLVAMVVIITSSIGQERTFKFNNIYAPNGDFSVKYLFPDSGMYQVITRINSNNPQLASFRVIVTPETSSLTYIITPVIIIAIIVGSISYFVSRKHHLNKRTETFVLIASISALLSAYFFLSLYAFPNLYVTPPKIRPIPVINNVSLSSSVIEIGHSFNLNLSAANNGDSADLQTISVGFPNLTSIDGFVQIRQDDLNQKPLFIKKGEMVGSDYRAGNLISAKYPSIDAFSRP